MDTVTNIRPAASFPLPQADLDSLGFRKGQIDRLIALIERHIAEGRYPGCQIALARHGKLALFKSFGNAVTEPKPRAAADDTLWLLYSNTKVVTAVALWALAERGLFSFSDRIADHVPEFAKNAKGNITVLQTITHQAGFPNAVVGKDAWADHKRLREVVCDFPLEWTPGSKVHYHGLTAHWTLGVLIEAVTGKDFRDVIRETVAEPLGLGRELYVGLPEAEFGRAADMHEPKPGGDGFRPDADANSAEWRKGGAPGGAGYGTARAMAALYQMMLQRRRAQRHAHRVAAHPGIRHPQPHRRSGRRIHGHAHASRAGAAPPRHDGEHPRAGRLRQPERVRPWRRRHVLLLGRSRIRRVVRLRHQQPHPRPLAQQAPRPCRQLRALGDLSSG